MSLYFLAASLPMLSFEGEPPISLEDFRNRCSEHLSGRDQAVVEALLAENMTPSRNRFVSDWRDRETQLRNAIVKVRAQRKGLDAKPFTRPQEGFDSYIEKAVIDAFGRPNPLERERALDRFRWKQIEELAGFDPFTTNAILAYALQLQMVHRWAAQNPAAGRQQAQNLVSSNPEAALL
jgi:hypothetical protein